MRIKLMLAGMFIFILGASIFMIMSLTPSSDDTTQHSTVIKKTGSTIVVPTESTSKTVKLVPANQPKK